MSFLDTLFNGTPPPDVTTSTNSSGSMPLWYASYLSSLTNAAASVASQDYQTYPGQRIANQDPQQQAAYGFLGQNAGNWQQPLDAAQAGAASVAGGFNANEFQKYQSPYIGGVVNEIGRLGNQNLNENLLPTLNSQFIGTGGFGSQRNMDMAERLTRDVGANISGQQGMALQGAFSSAMDKYLQGQNTTANAAGTLGNLAGQDATLTAGTAGALAASGQSMQNYSQQNMDLAYSDYLNQLNYPRQNVSFLSSVLRGQQVPTGQDATQTAPFSGTMAPSPLATFGGLALAGLGTQQKAKGGQVLPMRRRPARGGLDIASMRAPRGGMPALRGGFDLMAA